MTYWACFLNYVHLWMLGWLISSASFAFVCTSYLDVLLFSTFLAKIATIMLKAAWFIWFSVLFSVLDFIQKRKSLRNISYQHNIEMGVNNPLNGLLLRITARAAQHQIYSISPWKAPSWLEIGAENERQ